MSHVVYSIKTSSCVYDSALRGSLAAARGCSPRALRRPSSPRPPRSQLVGFVALIGILGFRVRASHRKDEAIPRLNELEFPSDAEPAGAAMDATRA